MPAIGSIIPAFCIDDEILSNYDSDSEQDSSSVDQKSTETVEDNQSTEAPLDKSYKRPYSDKYWNVSMFCQKNIDKSESKT